jgi:hypothetical protein
MLFQTVHGSRLYGLAHEGSDYDWYTVVPKVHTARATYAKQKVVDNLDTTVIDLPTWLKQCQEGVPQALEAMFSQMATHDDLGALRAGYRVGTQVYETYYKTIKSFALSEDYKRKRHSLRLALNLQELGRYGRFNPTLSEADARYVSDMATKSNADVYGLALCLAWE